MVGLPALLKRHETVETCICMVTNSWLDVTLGVANELAWFEPWLVAALLAATTPIR